MQQSMQSVLESTVNKAKTKIRIWSWTRELPHAADDRWCYTQCNTRCAEIVTWMITSFDSLTNGIDVHDLFKLLDSRFIPKTTIKKLTYCFWHIRKFILVYTWTHSCVLLYRCHFWRIGEHILAYSYTIMKCYIKLYLSNVYVTTIYHLLTSFKWFCCINIVKTQRCTYCCIINVFIYFMYNHKKLCLWCVYVAFGRMFICFFNNIITIINILSLIMKKFFQSTCLY